MANSKLNGSVQALAQALSDVFVEALKPVREDVKGLKDDVGTLTTRVDGLASGLDTTAKNVQAQLAQHRKEVNDILDRRLPE